MKRLTDEELTQIKERAEKATKGPWDVDVPVDYCTNCKNGYEIVQSELFLAPIVAELKDVDNASFIAHAREDIPKLIVEIEELEKDLLELVKQNKELRKSIAFYSSESYNAYLERLLDRREQQIKRYREALEFYANKENWKKLIIDNNTMYLGKMNVEQDYGEKARQALEGEE